MFLAILVGFRVGKGGVATKPEKLEPAPVALHYGLDELQSAIGGMDVPRSQLCPQTIALAGKAEKRMETVLGKMAIVGNSLLLAVGRVLGGIQIDDQPLFVLPFQQGIGGLGSERRPRLLTPRHYPGRHSPTGRAWTGWPLA